MKKLIMLAMIMTIVITSFSQAILTFYGYEWRQYQYPVTVKGEIKPSYRIIENYRGSDGFITINRVEKTFVVSFGNGDVWKSSKCKVDITDEVDPFYGDVVCTWYEGKWINANDNSEALLLITKTKNNGCVTQIKSRKINGWIDTFKDIFTLAVAGDCSLN